MGAVQKLGGNHALEAVHHIVNFIGQGLSRVCSDFSVLHEVAVIELRVAYTSLAAATLPRTYFRAGNVGSVGEATVSRTRLARHGKELRGSRYSIHHLFALSDHVVTLHEFLRAVSCSARNCWIMS